VWISETIPPTSPLAPEEIAAACRLSTQEAGAQQPYLDILIAGAVRQCETFTGYALIERELELWLESWWEPGVFRAGRLRLPRPVVSEIASIEYLDSAGDLQTWSEVTGWDSVLPGGQLAARAEVFLRDGQCYPVARCQPKSIVVTYTAGFGVEASDIPAGLKEGLLIWLAEAYERREEVTAGSSLPSNPIGAERCWLPWKRQGI